ncbi:MAG: hypothetical protein EPO58_11275 [Chitinophagaceae bacterium]|nr:MAG: hypothetical protein EPO58_11275 [Chitinophagaceae bacterium]
MSGEDNQEKVDFIHGIPDVSREFTKSPPWHLPPPHYTKRFYMTDNQKFIAGLLLGAVAGAALALFMKTEKGQEILSEVQEGADKVQDELKEKLHEFDTAVNDLLSKGKAFISDLEQKSQQTGTGTGA